MTHIRRLPAIFCAMLAALLASMAADAPILIDSHRQLFLDIGWKYNGPESAPWHKGQRRGLGVAASPDGIHWKLIDSWATSAISDGATHWMFDPAHEKYVLYGRTLKARPEVAAAWQTNDWFKRWFSGRAVARVESSDFLTWDFTKPDTAPVVMTADLQDPPGTEIYSMKVFPYEGIWV